MAATTATFSPEEVAALADRLGLTDEVDLEQLRIGMAVELDHGRRDPLTNVTDDDPLLTATDRPGPPARAARPLHPTGGHGGRRRGPPGCSP